MGVVTISRQYGAGGHAVANRVAEQLGYVCMDKELIVEVARRGEVPVSEVERFDECPEHPAVRFLKLLLTPSYPCAVGLGGEEWMASAALPELSDADMYAPMLDEDAFVCLTQEVVRHVADQREAVILGRGSQALLAGRDDVLHVRLIAPEAFRLRVAQETEGASCEAEARKRMACIDKQRRRYVKRHFGIDLCNELHYHLVLNTAQLGMDGAAEIISLSARQLATRSTVAPLGTGSGPATGTLADEPAGR